MNDFWNRPCAGAGLQSYRYRGRFGWIMIGARSDEEALSEARRSTEGVTVDRLERWDGERYVRVGCYCRGVPANQETVDRLIAGCPTRVDCGLLEHWDGEKYVSVSS